MDNLISINLRRDNRQLNKTTNEQSNGLTELK